jgi:DeoR family fructose operon transcriptional repressor
MSRKKFTPTDRRAEIRSRLLIDGSLRVEDLALGLKVSVATIRRDLTALEHTGYVQRTHGGARVGTPKGADQAFSLREQTDRDAKRIIARSAIGLIDAERTLFLNDGSTMFALAQELAAADMALTVATCGINVATTLSENPRIQAYLAGGMVRHRTLGTTGHFVDHMLSLMSADIAFIAAESVDAKDGMTYSYEEDAAIARKMSGRARKTVALATRRKLAGRDRFVALGPDQIDLLITDCEDPAVLGPFQKAGIDVIVARHTSESTLNDTGHSG